MKATLTKEEKKILDSFEKGEWIPVKNMAKRKEDCGFPAQNCHGRSQTSSLDEEVKKFSLRAPPRRKAGSEANSWDCFVTNAPRNDRCL